MSSDLQSPRLRKTFRESGSIVDLENVLTTSSLPPISVKTVKSRKRDSWRSKLAAGGNTKQRLLMATAPKETKPLVAALLQAKAKGADIKPMIDIMLATIAS